MSDEQQSEPLAVKDEIENADTVANRQFGLFFWGAVASGAYLLLMLIYAIGMGDKFTGMNPNEFADFLSGAFAPLAFFWLVLGFIQQGTELRNSADALWLQGRELNASVQQQKELVGVTKDQLEFERLIRNKNEEEAAKAAQPLFMMQSDGRSKSGQDLRYSFRLVNVGTTCSDVRFVTDAGGAPTKLPFLTHQGDHRFTLNYHLTGHPVADREMLVTFMDALGKKGVKLFKFVRVERDDPNFPDLIVEDVSSSSEESHI